MHRDTAYDDIYLGSDGESSDGTGFGDGDDGVAGLVFAFEKMEFDSREGLATFIYSFCGADRFVARTRLPRPWPPPGQDAAEVDIRCALFHVGLMILPWFWMGFGCSHVLVRAGHLTDEQVSQWEEFYQGALAEYFFLNSLGPEHHIRLDVRAPAGVNDALLQREVKSSSGEVLCCLGGGKDSIVVIELLRRWGRQPQWLYVGDGFSEYDSKWFLQEVVRVSGATVLVAAHELNDPAWRRARVRSLRVEGHPWAALVASTAAAVAVAWGVPVVAVGNERSAAMGNGISAPGGLQVNHQYDKSAACERVFREYFRSHIWTSLEFFSPLQPLWELQIARAFCGQASTRRYLHAFMSCNEPPQMDWCGKCAKCCFIYLLLAAFLPHRQVAKVFANVARKCTSQDGLQEGPGDLLADPTLASMFGRLIGYYDGERGKHKPFDCVGTEHEARLALRLALCRRAREEGSLPAAAATSAARAGFDGADDESCTREVGELLRDWDQAAWLPEWLPSGGGGWFLDDRGCDLLGGAAVL